MDAIQLNMSLIQVLNEMSCQDIEEFITQIIPSESELKNSTREEYIQSLRSPHCEPKPYPTAQGWKKWSVTVILVSFLLFGLIGNLLSATIMFRRARRGLSSYFYLAMLALVDICILYSSCLVLFFENTFDYYPQISSKISCRLIFFIQHLFTYISAWLIVAVTFERLLVVRYPFHSIRISRIQAAYSITIVIMIFFVVYTCHCFLTIDLRRVNIQSDQGYHPNHLICDIVIHRHLFSFIDLCFYSVLPSMLIIICNLLIIYTMRHAIRQRRDYLQANSSRTVTRTSPKTKGKSTSTHRSQFLRSRSAESTPAGRSSSLTNKRLYQPPYVAQNHKQKNQQKNLIDSNSATSLRLTCLLLIISFIFIICTLPISIRLLISDYLPSQKSTTRWQNTQLCLTLLMFFNHTVNFLLYCLTGRTFRTECMKLLRTFWLLKDLRLSCMASTNADKYPHYHQQFALLPVNRPVYITQQQQHQRARYLKPAGRHGIQL